MEPRFLTVHRRDGWYVDMVESSVTTITIPLGNISESRALNIRSLIHEVYAVGWLAGGSHERVRGLQEAMGNLQATLDTTGVTG